MTIIPRKKFMEIMDIGKNTVLLWVKKGMPEISIGRKRFYNLEECQNWIENNLSERKKG